MTRTKLIALLSLCICLISAIALSLMARRPTRCAVFAGYNKDGIIAPYVIDYLKALNEIAPNCVVYIADSPLALSEEQKLKGLAVHTEHIRHNEYDWGSYKRGYNWLKQNGYLKNADELVLANDSCYAPLSGSFKPMFEEMSRRPELDFWADLKNTRFNLHLQSYFMVFRKKIINSRAFAFFLNNVTHEEPQSQYIINYELKLTPYLQSLGYRFDSFMPYEKLSDLELEDKNSYPLTLIKDYHHQFLKRRTFTTNLDIREDKAELLRYLKTTAPKTYHHIITDFPHLLKKSPSLPISSLFKPSFLGMHSLLSKTLSPLKKQSSLEQHPLLSTHAYASNSPHPNMSFLGKRQSCRPGIFNARHLPASGGSQTQKTSGGRLLPRTIAVVRLRLAERQPKQPLPTGLPEVQLGRSSAAPLRNKTGGIKSILTPNTPQQITSFTSPFPMLSSFKQSSLEQHPLLSTHAYASNSPHPNMSFLGKRQSCRPGIFNARHLPASGEAGWGIYCLIKKQPLPTGLTEVQLGRSSAAPLRNKTGGIKYCLIPTKPEKIKSILIKNTPQWGKYCLTKNTPQKEPRNA